AMTGTIIFFLGLQQIGTVGTTAPENRFQISIAPNPADQYISISGITHPGRYDILDYYGKTVQSGNISGGDQIILLQSLPAGVYLFRVETSGGWTTGKVVVR
ncbi:MAG: T9SS type A sorting domain-containing protein, partial [Saprospiraceae bacterium]|nr:T9SS type A sorting domain-containing protein [Saprospiraceae bacterium]